MKIEPGLDLDSKVRSALDELAASIRRQYPDASFRVSRGEDDPAIVQLIASVNVDDTDPVLDVIMDRLLDLQDEGLPLFVVTERPLERTIALREATRAQRGVVVPAP